MSTFCSLNSWSSGWRFGENQNRSVWDLPCFWCEPKNKFFLVWVSTLLKKFFTKLVCLSVHLAILFIFFHLENFFKHSSLLGLAPNITEREVFDNPSRTARLVAAYYDYTHNMRQTMWYVSSSSSPSAPLQVSCEYLRNFVKPFLHGFLLACSHKDRILYSNHLMVHGKKRTNISQCSKDLLFEFEVCVPIIQACCSSPLG